MSIHPTAIISPQAKLGQGVRVGAYAMIEGDTVIGPGTEIGPHCHICRNANIGKNCRIFTGAVIGSIPQDLKFRGEESFLEVGDNNIIREYATINRGTDNGGKTIVGYGNLIMAYSHIAHDCRIGDGCVIANGGTLAGHVNIEDRAIIGGLVAIHQFTRVGRLSIVGGCSKVIQDVPPYSTCDGHPVKVYGLNLLGLRRAKLGKEDIHRLKAAFRILFFSRHILSRAIKDVAEKIPASPYISYLLDFVSMSRRGICRAC
ncbi:MAG: acyl-ACP--UDP-N-acetylglucosamine O-acyltransferase [Candidatus Omnitrophota bacterium]